MGKKTAFVLSGGGAAGAWQVGALKAFDAAGIQPDFITANSAGSLNAVGLSYAGIAELEAMWRSIKSRKDIFVKNWPFMISLALGRDSLFSSKPLREKVKKIMNGRQARWPVCVNSVSLKDGVLRRTWDCDPHFQDHVIASASIPLVAEPVLGEFVDGGIRENSPLRPALERGAERIFLFLNAPKNRFTPLEPIKKVSGLRQIGSRTLAILMDEAFWEDISMAEADQKRDLEFHIIQPTMDYMQTMDFDPGKIANAISKGFLEAQQALEAMQPKVAK